MADEGFKRKLAAILSADVEGYSRLMDDDEEATVRTLTSYRNAITDLVQQFRGRVVDAPGDNLLAEFTSVVDAVNCAVEIQRDLAERNAELAYKRQMQFRIGVNLGDVIEEDGRIYGDGVNIAARVESLSEAGGICISGRAQDQVENKLGLEYEDLGKHEVKNISRPIQVYRVLSYPGAAAHRVVQAKETLGRRWRKIGFSVAAIVIITVAIGIWQFYVRRPTVELASLDKMAFPLPEKPSIAVLPFDNVGGDPEQEYFSDGVAENIITQLAQTPNLFVISRESTFTYKDKNVKVKQVAEEMGVRFVLEGSVQGSGDRVRVTVQLIDAITGRHVWADRYERELKNIFAIQDEITQKVMAELVGKLVEGEQSRLIMQKSPNVEAYKYWLKSQTEIRKFTKEGNLQARKLAEKAIEIDPQYSLAYSMIAWTHIFEVFYGRSKNPTQDFKEVDQFINKALEVDPNNADVPSLLGFVYFVKGQYDQAISQGRRTVERWPSLSDPHSILAWSLVKAGHPAEAIEEITIAMRLAPFYPSWFLHCLGQSYFLAGRYEEAIIAYKKYLEREPERVDLYAWLAVINSAMGREKQARIEANELLKNWPTFSLKQWRSTLRFKDEAVNDRIIYYASKAGLPEHPPLKLPDKPSIAVLPFNNLSDDPGQEYFADGMADDLITDLSKISGLFVIARNSAFQYKGKVVDVKEVSRDLGVKYVLEGSVRRAGEKVRINAQLIDATTGGHLWAERYDGQIEDIFSLQDKITQKIVTALAVKLTSGEKENIASKGTDNIEAYDAFLKGWQHYLRYTPEDCAIAIEYLNKALELDPDYGQAYAALAHIYYSQAGAGREWAKALQANYFTARVKARYFLNMAMKNPNSLTYRVASEMDLPRRHHEEALQYAEKATLINPNDADSQFAMARVLVYSGSSKEGIDVAKKVMQLDPNRMADCLRLSGIAHFYLGEYEAAIASFERAIKYNPSIWVQDWIASAYSNLNQTKEAKAAFEKFKKRWLEAVESELSGIKFDLQLPVYSSPFMDIKITERYVDGLIKAGAPEPHKYYEADKKNKLTGDEIKDLVFGRTEHSHLSGQTATIKFKKNGNAVWNGYGFKDEGKWWVEGDQLCQSWNNFFGEGLTYYSDIYRNPEGTLEEINQYIRITDFNMYGASYID